MANKIKQKIVDFLPSILGRKNMYRIRYYHQRKKLPNFSNPRDLSEIILVNIMRGYYERYAPLEDKIVVRNYIKEKGLEDILLKQYYTWNNVDDIDIDKLPEKFVLKTNNGSGGKNIFICRDKNIFDINSAKEKLRAALAKKDVFEKQYNLIEPKVICEELIDTGCDAWPTDYKFTCIHGEIVDIFIGTEREKEVKFCTKDLNWNPLPYTKEDYLPTKEPKKPETLEEMIRIAKILSKDFPFVRVDLYDYRGHVYFSELTFTPWGGLMYSYKNETLDKYGELLRSKNTDYLP